MQRRNAGGLFLTCLIALAATGCFNDSIRGGSKTVTTSDDFHFVDITGSVELHHYYENGEKAGERAILETIGGGVAVLDYDRDGFDDLCFASGGLLNDKRVSGLGCTLFRNFVANSVRDISLLAGIQCPDIYTHGTIAGDLNNDGFPDLLITGYYGLALFINQGDGTFLEQAQSAGMKDPKWGTSAALGDFNSDGSLDLYIAHYVDWSFSNHPDCTSAGKPDVCAPGIFTGITDVIYLNQNDGTFEGKSSELGLVPEGKGLGVVVADFDQDSKCDIYVANDTTNNLFYLNKGGKFEEIGLANGTAVDDMGTPQGSMGLCVLDYDSDLLTDLMVSNYENQAFALYKNDGDSNFRYATSTTGLQALGTTYVAWGSSACDFDLDGDEDVVVVNGHVMMSNPPEQLPLFLKNLDHAKFQGHVFPEDSYFSKLWRGRGIVALDWDKDGDLDLAISHVNQDAVLLRNDTLSTGNWWILKLVGTQSSRDPIGARVVVESVKGRKLLRNIFGGGSYLSQNPYQVHFGLPKDDSIQQIRIEWPSGYKQILATPDPRTTTLVVEPNS